MPTCAATMETASVGSRVIRTSRLLRAAAGKRARPRSDGRRDQCSWRGSVWGEETVMAKRKPSQLTSDQAREKAVEPLELAKHARDTFHQIMLQHIAETWERIARNIDSKR